jgi:hypothetical protein
MALCALPSRAEGAKEGPLGHTSQSGWVDGRVWDNTKQEVQALSVIQVLKVTASRCVRETLSLDPAPDYLCREGTAHRDSTLLSAGSSIREPSI